MNEVAVADLHDGGQLTLPVSEVGGNFNVAAVDGYFGSTLSVLEPMYNLSTWRSSAEGEVELNTDYVLSVQEEFDDQGTQILHYELNPDAVWNDGTPIDFYTYEHTVNVNKGREDGYDALAGDLFDRVDTIEMGADEWSFTMTMATTQHPHRAFFGSYAMVHPDVDTPEAFNDSFVGDPKPEYRAGPYILDIYDEAANVISMVPNPNWWGDEPALDRLNFVQYEHGPTMQAFQNGQIDAVELDTVGRYEELANWNSPDDGGYDIRRGLLARNEGFLFNGEARNLGDVQVRQAIFQATDRELLSQIRFQGLNWEEELPGSWLLMSNHELYRDNYPEEFDQDAARQTLVDAGWEAAEDGEIRTNSDGEPLTVDLMTFGDDDTESAIAQSFQTMMSEVGIDIQIRSRGSAEFAESMNTGDFAIARDGYGAGTDAWGGPPTFFVTGPSNNTGLGDEELDEWIESLTDIADDEERALQALDIEEHAISSYYHYLVVYNGPEIWAFRDGLANYGPRLFETIDWTAVGWEAGADHDGTDTGVDVQDLEDDS